MNGWIVWLARNPVAANLLMVLIVASGLLALPAVTLEVFPEVDLDQVDIQVAYPGAAPEEVEGGVVARIEEAIQGIEGIRRIESTATEGNASVRVVLELDTDTRRVIDEVRNQVDAITTFPTETERPIIRERTIRNQVADVVIYGSAELIALKSLAEKVRDGLSALPAITLTEIVNAPQYEISIEVSEASLRRHGLTLDDVAEAVRRTSLDLPGGSVLADDGEILLRTIGQAYRGHEYENLVLWTREDGRRLLLGDVASVVDGLTETEQHARFDGKPAMMVSVFRTGRQNALEVAEAVHSYVENLQARLPPGISMAVWQDQAVVLEDRLSLMLRNGYYALLLVFLVLAFFLPLRQAFWVSVGIPVAFLGAIALIPWMDVSVNAISLFAFILVLGIVVDDAVVVGENVRRHQEQHGDGLRGAIDGAREIAKPVIYGVLTTIAVFLPLMFAPGIMGRFLRVIPLIVISCLIFSLVESLGILPAHLSHHSGRRGSRAWGRLQQRIAAGFARFVRSVYEPLLEIALRWRYQTAAIAMSVLLVTGGMTLGGRVPFRFMPSIESDFITAAVAMPQGSLVNATSSAVEKLESSAARLRARLLKETGIDYFRHVSATVGDQPIVARAGGPVGPLHDTAAPNVGEVTVELAPAERRSYSSEHLGAMWRELTDPIPGAASVTFDTSLIAVGNDVDVQLTGPNLDHLRAAAQELKRRLAEYAGVHEIADSFVAGKRELRIGIKPAVETLGLSLKDLGRQVRQAFHGEEAQRIQRGRNDVRVMVRYPRDDRRLLASLENMRIRKPDGGQVPFSQVAEIEPGRGFAAIRRVDRNRAVNVTASVDPAIVSASAVIEELRLRLLPDVLAGYPEVAYTFQGIQADQEEAVGGLLRGFILSMLAIFGLLAVPLVSYLQPLIVLTAVPFGFVGAIWGHLVMGVDMTLMSMFGFVALSGVVVNDSLLMVHAINRSRNVGRTTGQAGGRGTDHPRSAASLRIAVRKAGSQRFRPIVVTSLTTFAGLAPLMLEKNIQAMFVVPMAVSLAFGVIFATGVTLILVPVTYLILEDFRQLTRWLFAGARRPAAGPSPDLRRNPGGGSVSASTSQG